MNPAEASRRPVASSIPANINAVRGIACLLVVALHVIGDTAANGLHLPMTSNWHYAMASIEFLRMPLFTALSGYLYAGNRVTRAAFRSFWQKKVRRLGVPFVTVTIVMWFLRQRAYDDPTSLTHALLFGLGHLWYIQALIVLFVLISVADSFFRPGFATLVLGGLLSIMAAQSGITISSFFSLNTTIYIAPYFLFGILLRTRPDWLSDARSGIIALGIIVIVLVSQQIGMLGLAQGVTLLQLPAALAGMACVVFMLQRMPRNKLLAVIGGYSYTVYLWHVIVNAAVRSLLIKAGISNVPALFCVCFIAAVILPIMLYHLARFIPLISVAVTGERHLRLAPRKRFISTVLEISPAGAPMLARR